MQCFVEMKILFNNTRGGRLTYVIGLNTNVQSLHQSRRGLYAYASHLHLYEPRYCLYRGQYRSVQCPHQTPALTDTTKGKVQLPSAQDIVAGSLVRALTNLEEEQVG